MDDKGEVKCIKFSIGNKILAVQRTTKSVVSLLRGHPGYSQPAVSGPSISHEEIKATCSVSLASVQLWSWVRIDH